MVGTLIVDSYVDLLNHINIRESSSKLLKNIIDSEKSRAKEAFEELLSIY